MASQSEKATVISPSFNFYVWSNWLVKYACKGLDPYLIWAFATGFRQLPRSDEWLDSYVSFIVESKSAMALGDTTGALNGSYYPDQYAYGLGAEGNLPRYFTLRTPVKPQGYADPIDYNLESLLDAPDIVRFQMGFTADSKSENRQFPSLEPIPFAGATDVVVCALDDGCPFAHAHLRDASNRLQSRVVALWDQTPRRLSTSPWTAPGGVTYGGQLVAPAINREMTMAAVDGVVDEDRIYERAGALHMHGLDQRHTHGAAVLDLLAGNTASESCFDDSLRGTRPVSDAASRAPIVFIQFPDAEVTVPNGRWLVTNALDGVHWAIRAAEMINATAANSPERERKVVINMSYGALAGPHDGTSMLVKALDEVCELRGNTAITVAAGNAREKDCHSTLRRAVNELGILQVLIPPDKTAETYVEVWFPEYRESCNVSLSVIDPTGQKMSVAVKELQTLSNENNEHVAAVIFPRRVAQGTNGTMALLVVSATAVDGQIPPAAAGVWTIEIIDRQNELVANAWIERDELSYGNNPQQQARFVGSAKTASAIATDNTLTNTAGGRFSFTVGSYCADGQRIANYSAEDSASALEDAVVVYAPSDTSRSVRGIRVAGTRTGTWSRPSGTSMAAPQVARTLANVFATEKASLTAKDVKALLGKALILNPMLKQKCELAPRLKSDTDV